MNVTVFGSTGGTGRAVTRTLLAAGHRVTAFARDPARLDSVRSTPGCTAVLGNAMMAADVAPAVAGADAVVVTLGNSQNPFAMMVGARRTTSPDICEVGTRNVVDAMRERGVGRLVVVTAFGVGDTRALPSGMAKLFFRLVLAEHMADKEKQERLVKASGLDWTLAQPVSLTDGKATGTWSARRDGAVRKAALSRADLAAFIVGELDAPAHFRETVTLSG